MSGKTVLVTGCSDGGLGAALAIAFKQADYRVLAAARNPAKLSQVKQHGIETLSLEVTSPESIKQAVAQVGTLFGGSLDVLVNNAGMIYSAPLVEADVDKVRQLFEVNVFAVLAVTQAFFPLLRKSRHGGMVANNTSIAATAAPPLQSTYNASKAAVGMMTTGLRQELEPFGIKVVDLRTGTVLSNIFNNSGKVESNVTLRPGSIYEPIKDKVERLIDGTELFKTAIPADVWAQQVVSDLSKAKPPAYIWRGGEAWIMQYVAWWLPHWVLDRLFYSRVGFDVLAKSVSEEEARTRQS